MISSPSLIKIKSFTSAQVKSAITLSAALGPTISPWISTRSSIPPSPPTLQKRNPTKTSSISTPQIQAVLADPPYTPEFSAYFRPGLAHFVSGAEFLKHSLPILPIGGRVGILSLHWPRYPKTKARQIALIAVYVGNGNLGRTFAVYEKIAH